MQKTVEYTNNRVSPATIELLIRERSKGKTLRQLRQVFGKSHEKIRQVLAEYDVPQIMLVPESNVAAKLGYPGSWLARLRKDGYAQARSQPSPGGPPRRYFKLTAKGKSRLVCMNQYWASLNKSINKIQKGG